MFGWKHGDPYGQEVRTADHLDKRDFVEEALRSRRPGATGTVVAHHDGHGLCFDVRHPDGTIGCYDPDELEFVKIETELSLERERCVRLCDELAAGTIDESERAAARSLADRIRALHDPVPDNRNAPIREIVD